jgi:TonB-dependent starch-binding outer membrane protein SusC
MLSCASKVEYQPLTKPQFMKNRLYRCLGVSVLLLLVCLEVSAQQSAVSGTVKDASGSNMPGVSISIKGTAVGTVADKDGNYVINASPQDVLMFSFIGYKPQEIPVAQQLKIDVTLSEDIQTLEEVVVIGYGEIKRKDVTGSISSINAEEIRKTNPVTFDQALQGKVPGLVVQQVSGQPGGGVSIQIRGISSFGGSTPMFVIDGVIIGSTANVSYGQGINPLAGINPWEIESIDVLKDASATAIYGSQATNGVVIITTKRGQVAPPKITYDFNTGFQQIPRRLPTMDLQEFASFINERNTTGIGWDFDQRPEFANPQYLGKGTDWQDELFRTAQMTNHTVTVNGGDSRTQYLFSGSYFKQGGIAVGSDLKRISVRLNLDNKTTDWLKIGTSLQFANIQEKVNSTTSNVIREALRQTPDIAVQNPDGSWGGNYNPDGWVNRTVNPYAIAVLNKDEIRRNQLFANVYAEITFLPGLTLRNEANGTFSTATEDKFNPKYTMGLVVRDVNSASYDFSQNSYTMLRNYLTYVRSLFNNRFNSNIMVGHEAQLNKSEGVYAYRETFPSNNVQVISGGDPATAKNSGTKNHSAQESYFGRLNFGLDDKYLLTANVRADGSSKFAAGRRWVTTYSAGFAWKLKNEFLQIINEVNELKLRVGYGLTNNQNIGDYAYTSTLTTVPTGLSGVSQLTKTMGNPYVEWEKTKYSNIGLDGALFNRRIDFSVDFYNRLTDDLLMKIPLPAYTGTATQWSPGSLEAPWVNVGSIRNKGFDFRISSTIVERGNFSWRTDLTVSRNINQVVKLNTDGASLEGWPFSKTVVGRSIGEFYGYQVEGVFATPVDFFGDVEKGIKPHARPVDSEGNAYPIGSETGSIWYGDLKFKDVNGDGYITADDQTFLGSPLPKAQIGLNNSFTYKNFDLNIFFTANVGNKVYNQLRIEGEYPGTSYGYFEELNNYAKLALIDPNGSATDPNNVYVTNPDTKIPGLRNDNTNVNNRRSDLYVEDGSFLRCKTISLGYTVSEKLLQKIHVGSLRVYANVSNAFLITKYKGMDPEIGSWDPLNAGYDNGYYPQPRVFTIGANLQLSK